MFPPAPLLFNLFVYYSFSICPQAQLIYFLCPSNYHLYSLDQFDTRKISSRSFFALHIFSSESTKLRALRALAPCVLSCLVPYVPSCLTCLVPYVLSCFTCLVPYVLSCPTCLVPYVLSCLTCLVPYVLSCLTCFVPYVLLCPTCLVPYMLSCLTCFLPYVPFALRASCQTCSRVSRVLGVLVPQVSCALRVLGLAGTLRALLLLVPHLLQVFQVYASHVF